MTEPAAITLTAESVAAFVVLFASFLAALGYLGTKVRKAVHILDAVERVVQQAADNADEAATQAGASQQIIARELTENTGGSIKDDVSAIAYVVGNLWRKVDEVDERLNDHLEGQRRR